MEMNTVDNFLTILWKDKENINLKMDLFMLANLKMINSMELENCLIKMDLFN